MWEMEGSRMATVDRLPYDGVTEEEVYQYFKTRHLQLMQYGYRWDHVLIPMPGGYMTSFHDEHSPTVYDSFFVTADKRNKGYAVKMVREAPHNIITVDDCHVVEFIQKCGRIPVVIKGTFDTLEYKLVEQFYGNQRAKRSGVLLMNHIDEGLWVMQKIGATEEAKRAYCLHPLLQNDPDLKANLKRVSQVCDPFVIALAMEYRSQANAWLSDKVSRIVDRMTDEMVINGQPTAGPLQDVHDMLVADKIQNYKDFILHHKNTHARTQELDRYFQLWLSKLGVTDFDHWFKELSSLSPKE